ncbi:MAG: NAD-dependent epimerase/dehydratase family protein [Candidatus Micrarchaeales archaeon]
MAKTSARTTLVTGASGHLGPLLVQALIERGDKVRALVRTGNINAKGVEVLRGDILEVDVVRKATEGVDLVYHLAAVVDYAGASEEQMRAVNVQGTKNLLDNFKGKVVYQSTTSVYGYNMKENPATPTTPYNPSSEYGRTKVEAEQLILQRGGIVLRAPVIFGDGFNQSFIELLRRIQKGKMPIIGSGANHIQWICVDDLIDALLLAGERGQAGQAYLVAVKQAKTQKELFVLLANSINAQPPHKHISVPAITALVYLDGVRAALTRKKQKVTSAYIQRLASDRLFDISKAERELGFAPKVSYEIWAKQLAQEYTESVK